jgi:hypothetical protein
MSYFCKRQCRIFVDESAMKTNKNRPLEKRIAERVRKKKADVFVRDDFTDLGGYDQVGRSLRSLAARGELIKIGYGLYARAMTSLLSGKVVPRKPLPALAMEALERLDVGIRVSSSAKAYNEGRTTQVPTGRVIAVNGRISRKIGYDGRYVTFERSA